MLNNTPVLLLIFNRPFTTIKVFEAIRKAQPAKLFVGADGPRKDRDETELCNQVRLLATQVDWSCEVHTLFRDTNLGAGKAVSSAISWFFEHVEQGIILEDDCLPDLSFFTFCDALLNKYSRTPEIMAISGTNLLPCGWKPEKQSYLFAHGGVWGWATWKRAWELYDFDMAAWKERENRKKIKAAMKNNNWFYYFFDMFEGAYRKELDAWDLQWFYCILNHRGLFINPSVNLVQNIGFGPWATNTNETDSPYAKLSPGHVEFPLKHPDKIKVDKKYLRATFRFILQYNKSLPNGFKSWLRFYLNRVKKAKQV